MKYKLIFSVCPGSGGKVKLKVSYFSIMLCINKEKCRRNDLNRMFMVINSFSVNVSLLYPLKTPENWRFSDIEVEV